MEKTAIKRPPYALLVSVLALLSVFPPVATDMYLSAMDQIAESFGVGEGAVELSLSLFFFGLCIGQLILGPLIDAYGRKGPLLAGAVIFTVSSIGLLLTDNIVIFNCLRVFQAVGACAGMVVGRAMVTDLYEGRMVAKTMTILVMLMTLGPVIAPFAGSLFLLAWGWQSVFIAMVVLGFLAGGLGAGVLPETLPHAHRGEAPFKAAFKGYGQLLVNPAFILPALVASLIQAAMFAFITGSSGVFKGIFGLSNMQYGILFGVVAAALVIFSQVNNWLLNRFEPVDLISRLLPVFVIFAAALYLVSGTSNMFVLLVPLWLSIGFVGLLSANAMSVAMEAARGRAGIGSALMGACQFGMAFLCSSAVAVMEADDASPLALGILVPSALALLVWFVGGVGRRAAPSGE